MDDAILKALWHFWLLGFACFMTFSAQSHAQTYTSSVLPLPENHTRQESTLFSTPNVPVRYSSAPGSNIVQDKPQAWEPVVPSEACFSCNDGSHRLPLMPYWDHGLHLISWDEQFNLHIGGNAQWDSVWLVGPMGVLGQPASNATSTTNSAASLPRRARFKADGNIYQLFDFSIEFDFANATNDNKGLQSPTQDNVADSAFPCNVWLQIRDVPFLGHIRIGNQVVPVGMTNNTYQGFLPFLERADNMDGFYGPFDEGFDPGISVINWTDSERVTWRYGIFRPLKNAFGIGLDEYKVAGRVTALPVYEEDGTELIHVGFSMSQSSTVNNEFRLRARPLLRNGPGYAVPVLADTTTLPGENEWIIGPELAAVYGPFTMQAEWTAALYQQVVANGLNQGTVFFHGGYVQVLYFLTGEHQAYEKKEGVFGRVIPNRSLLFAKDAVSSWGAWQVGLRFSYLDLNDKAIDGGQIKDLTIGLNWFLNPNMKIQGNYLLAHRNGQQGAGDGWFSGFGVRAAFDF